MTDIRGDTTRTDTADSVEPVTDVVLRTDVAAILARLTRANQQPTITQEEEPHEIS